MVAKYVHDESVHNLQAPKQIVPLLMKLFHPNSVIDVGCGLGTFLHVFKEYGVKKIHGIDGAWTNRDLLSKYIPLDVFEEVNLEKKYRNNEKFDLAVCLEVAEHLKQECASIIVDTLTSLSDIIVFSAAVPFQGGVNHINEQWPSYWEELFNKHNYQMFDIIRPMIWDNSNIFYWYKQNMFVFAKKDLAISLNSNSANNITASPKQMIHPELYERKCDLLNFYKNKVDLAYEGRLPIRDYFTMLKIRLWRYIFRRND